jgi:hypothetical protein
MICPDCNGARAVPSLLDPEGYDSCPTCVVDAGETFVALDDIPPLFEAVWALTED